MTLKDIMAHEGLGLFGEISLLIFFLLFLFIVWRAFKPSRRQELDEMAMLPLDDDPTPSTRSRSE